MTSVTTNDAETPAERPGPSATLVRHDDLVYDIGMYTRADTRFYLKKGFRVVAIEAQPDLCRAAAEHFPREIAEGRLVVLNKVLAARSGTATFHVCETMRTVSSASEGHVAAWRAKGQRFQAIEVEAIALGEVVQKYGVPHYMKIDIEGSDDIALEALVHLEVRPRYVSFEVDLPRHREMISLALRAGYRRFALVSQRSVPGQSVPIPAREGRDAEHTFKLGQSGLFGAELGAPWVDAASLARECRRTLRQYRAARLARLASRPLGLDPEPLVRRWLPRVGDWFDVHAQGCA